MIPISEDKTEKTGARKTFRPRISNSKCTKCGLCSVVCPDNCIRQGKDSFPAINYDACTGCLICLRECPWNAISEEKEAK